MQNMLLSKQVRLFLNENKDHKSSNIKQTRKKAMHYISSTSWAKNHTMNKALILSLTCTVAPGSNTVDENIIATIKIRNNFCYLLEMVILPILLSQYWTFLYCSPFSYRSSTFAIAKVVTLNLFASSFVWVL